MGFDAALVRASRNNRVTCSVPKALAALSAKERKKAIAAINDRDDEGQFVWPGAWVADALTDESGVHIAMQTLNRHRKRGTPNGCACGD